MSEKIEWYKEVLELEPNSKVFFPLARMLAEENKPEEAIDVLQNGLTRHPEFLEARLYCIELLHKAGRAEECKAHVETLSGMFTTYGGFWQAWAACIASMKDSADTASALRFLAANFLCGPVSFGKVIEEGLESILQGAGVASHQHEAASTGEAAAAAAATVPAAADMDAAENTSPEQEAPATAVALDDEGFRSVPASAVSDLGEEADLPDVDQALAEAAERTGGQLDALLGDDANVPLVDEAALASALAADTAAEVLDAAASAESAAGETAEAAFLEDEAALDAAFDEAFDAALENDAAHEAEHNGAQDEALVADDAQEGIAGALNDASLMDDAATEGMDDLLSLDSLSDNLGDDLSDVAMAGASEVSAAQDDALAGVDDAALCDSLDAVLDDPAAPELDEEALALALESDQAVAVDPDTVDAVDVAAAAPDPLTALGDILDKEQHTAQADDAGDEAAGHVSEALDDALSVTLPDTSDADAMLDAAATVEGVNALHDTLADVEATLAGADDISLEGIEEPSLAGAVADLEGLSTERLGDLDFGTGSMDAEDVPTSEDVSASLVDADDDDSIHFGEEELHDIEDGDAEAAAETMSTAPVAPAREEFSIRTRSMAEVLAEQGDLQGALDIYQELVANATDAVEKSDLEQRMHTLQARLGGGSFSTEAVVEAPTQSDAVSAGGSGKDKLISMLEQLAGRVESRAQN